MEQNQIPPNENVQQQANMNDHPPPLNFVQNPIEVESGIGKYFMLQFHHNV